MIKQCTSRLSGIHHLRNSESDQQFLLNNRDVVLRDDIVRDDVNCAVFSEQIVFIEQITPVSHTMTDK